MTTTPNMDLLKRQRTFSIDETREQLIQGRPVQREAVISGAVDFKSLIFGDEGVSPVVTSNAKLSGSASGPQNQAPKATSSSSSLPSNAKSGKVEAKASTLTATAESFSPAEARKVEAALPDAHPVESASTATPTSEVVHNEEKEVVTEAAVSESIKSDPSSLATSSNAEEKPKKITPSTWAAMVKSSAAADATSASTTGVVRAKPSSTAGEKKPKNGASSAKSSSGTHPNGSAAAEKGITSGPAKESKEKDKDSRRRERRDRDRDGGKSVDLKSTSKDDSNAKVLALSDCSTL